VAKKGAICPIFEGDMPPKKIYPQKWPFIDGHSMKAVKDNIRVETEAISIDTVTPILRLRGGVGEEEKEGQTVE
jgi:hypothetical protein